MRAVLAPFVLGAAAVGVLLATGVLAAGMAAEASGWDDLRVALGPLVFVVFERAGETTATTFGAGLPAAAVLGGLLNALGAVLLRRRH